MNFFFDLLAVLGDLAFDHPLHAKSRTKCAAAFFDGEAGVVQQGRARMPELRCAPAGPRQSVIIATHLRIVFRRPHGHQIEFRLVAHMRLETLRRLPAIARGPAAAVNFTQNVFRRHRAVVHLNVLEHLVGESKLTGQHVHHVVIVFRLEHGIDDFFAPLQRAVGGSARALHLETGAGG